MTRRVGRWLGVLCAGLALSGCAGVVSREVRQEATPVGFDELRRDTDAFLGRTVILGGEIIETLNGPDTTTLVVLQRPLGRDERPRQRDASRGRFLVRVRGYLDPVIFSPRRRVTVAGTVKGTEVRLVGQAPYRYVVLEAREVHLLPPEARPDPWRYTDPFFPFWRDPFYPYWYEPVWGRRPW